MFYIIDCFTGWLLEVALGVNIGSFVQVQSGWLTVVVLAIEKQWD